MMKIRPKYLILLLTIACVAIIWTIVPYCLDLLSDESSITQPRGVDNPDSQPVPADVHNFASTRDFVYPVDNTRDPFFKIQVSSDTAAQVKSPGKKPNIILTGIIWDDENPIAIVADSNGNSHLMQVREEINKIKILAIHPKSIIIQSEGITHELALWPESVF